MRNRRCRHSAPKGVSLASFFLIRGLLVTSTAHGFAQQLQNHRASPPDHDAPRWLPRWRNVEVDYSAAAEYIEAHYGSENKYFSEFMDCKKAEQKLHAIKEDVHDARQGVFNDDLGVLEQASLSCCGFELKHAPTRITDWNDMAQIRDTYLPELDDIVLESFNVEAEEDQTISRIVWWQPMFRGEGVVMSNESKESSLDSSPTAPVAAMVHIDMDVGALDTNDLVRLVERNRVCQDVSFPRKELEIALSSGRRFAVINVWRNADFDSPIRSAPLGLLATRYKSDCKGSFPQATVDREKTRWYTYSAMKSDECLVFRQYDRNKEKPSDLWHCALPIPADKGKDAAVTPRRSFDVRALVVFHQKIPSHLDRFSDARPRPLLTFKESECFCKSQALARTSTSKIT